MKKLIVNISNFSDSKFRVVVEIANIIQDCGGRLVGYCTNEEDHAATIISQHFPEIEESNLRRTLNVRGYRNCKITLS